VIEMEMRIKFKEGLLGKGLYNLVNMVEAMSQRITDKIFDKAQGAIVVSSTPHPHAYLLAKQRAAEIDSQKAMAISMSRHDYWKGGGPV
jgi:hypothetical protein